MTRPSFLHALALAASLSFTACGGGADTTAPVDTDQPENSAFTLSVAQDKALLLQGSQITLTVQLQRKAGFEGAVQLTLADLPAGVTAGGVTIAAGASSATLTLDALAAAPHSLPTTVRVRGSAGALLASQSFTLTVRGLPGSVDTSFASGKLVQPVGQGEDYANAAAVQADGKLLVAGSSVAANGGTQFSLVRYGRDGTLDNSFGNGGKLMTAIGNGSNGNNDQAMAVAVQQDGKILVAGRSQQGTSDDFAIVRYLANGTLDASFGNGGKVLIDFAGGTDVARALLVQADGKIVVAGEAAIAGTGIDFALARLNADGTPDAGFGQGGKVNTALKSGTGTDTIRALALQAVEGENRILAVGGDGDFLAARYTAAGVLDAGFAQGGKLVGVFGSNIGGAHAVTVLPDGRAVLAGHVNHDFALAQLTVTGALDAGFGSAGKVVRAVTTNWDEATAIARQADGCLVVGGWAYSGNSSSGDFVAMRLTAAGLPDASFGQQGLVLTPMAGGSLNDLAHALVLQADERLPAVRAIQAGEANGANHDFAITRLWL
jgi:uncharacterized delta-60 repeat protein